jgi:hypothetical protein
MAQASESNTGSGNTAVPHQGDHDRVQMLSLKADGTPDQHNPELIGERGATLEATKRQFAEQAVSAVDVAERHTVSGGPATGETVEQDPRIAEVQAKTEAAAQDAHNAAESAVDALLDSRDRPAATKGNTATSVPAGERKPADRP